MEELKISKSPEVFNETQELKRLLQQFDLLQENPSMNLNEADNLLNDRLELQKPVPKIKENFRTPDLDINYFRELKQDLKECNPNYNLGREWKVNCQRCVPTFELRRRGYDVTAMPRKGRDLSGLSHNPFSVWKNPEVIKCRDNGLQDIERNMEKWGDGARAEVVVMWKGSFSGHAFFAERVNGKTRFYDPQNGSMDVSEYFKRVEPNSVKICRVDNLKFDEEKIKDCVRMV